MLPEAKTKTSAPEMRTRLQMQPLLAAGQHARGIAVAWPVCARVGGEKRFRINQAQTHNMTHLWVEVASWLPALLFPPILALGGRREGLPRPREAAPQRSTLMASSNGTTSRCRLRRRSGRGL